MKPNWNHLFITQDEGLLQHWRQALGKSTVPQVGQWSDFFLDAPQVPTIAWVDLSLPARPDWASPAWRDTLRSEHFRIAAASSNPNDSEAMVALDAGCAAYFHAFSDAKTLRQVRDVVEAGHVWIGKDLMQRLLRGVNHVVASRPAPDPAWSEGLTQREMEVAVLAANGASNLAIAQQCRISERTVKAHLSAIFGKLNITDRLQLALRVHGIH
jgi:DNA-binding NarL/FixJ family response regulator